MATGDEAVQLAVSQKGKPYVFGAMGPNSFDCSGLMGWAYHQLGITLPRDTWSMVAPSSGLQAIGRGDLRSGDLVFFSDPQGRRDGHVGMFMGGNQIVEAGNPVQISTMSESRWASVTNYRRVPGLDGNPSSPGLLDNVIGAVGGAVSTVGGLIPTPGNLTEAASNIGTAIGGLASSAASVGKLATLVTHALNPNNVLRGFALLFGTIFILIGIWFLALEVKDSSP